MDLSDDLHWYGLSHNYNAIHLLEHHLYKIHWSSLSANPSTIHILETNLDKSICSESLKILPSLRIVIYETLQT